MTAIVEADQGALAFDLYAGAGVTTRLLAQRFAKVLASEANPESARALNIAKKTPLLELAGLIAVIQFGLTRMVRSSDRRQVIDGLRQRWQSFRGRG